MAVRVTRSGVALTVGIIIIGLLVLGGLYVVKQRGEQARREDAIQVAQENLESQSSQNGALNPGTDSSDTATTPRDDGDRSQQMPTGGNSNAATPGELPATGPTEVASLFAVALLSFSMVAYAQSRKLRLQ